MRILLVLGTSAGGVGRHVHGLVEGLTSRGHSVVVACPSPVEAQFRFADAGARHLRLDVTDRPHPLRDARAVSVLAGVIRRADVVHAHGLRAGALACLGAIGTGRPVAVTLHNAPPQGRRSAAVYAVLERIVARRAAAVLGVSADLVERQERLGARSAGLAVIPGPAASDGVADRDAVRSALGIADDELLAVVVARLAPQKGLGTLLDATALLGDLALEVVVAGDGPERDTLQSRIEREGLPVRLLGHRADVPDLLAAADVVVSSAVWEGQPINLQEALHAGAVIVATDVGGTAAVLGDAAVLVPPGDARTLARAIRSLAEDPGERSRLGERARTRSAQLPTPRDAVDAVERLYAGHADSP